ncbi:uncharacterized protein LOC131023515 [Salvia miltiorrhiza]|uniref:uncharacterized protein LOC131023515 n=1 Tax=Salvia miltiorrhiza TaxID=226208 RepID=UPI0025ACC187|nr:uncharacterized protein LOC131023515 [Salvia miltiorrhiza]
MKAGISPNCSYVWRSICWGRELLAGGLRWNVGDGNLISVMHDKWIPGCGAWKAEENESVSENLMVSELLTDDKKWDVARLQTLFPHFVVKLPPKVLHFAWRALHDMIAISENMRCHHVPTTHICYWCGKVRGTTTHGLIWCDLVREEWKTTKFWADICNFKNLRLMDLCLLIKDKRGEEGVEKWFFLLWMTWKFLCEVKYGKNEKWERLNLDFGQSMFTSYHSARQQVLVEAQLLPKEGARNWYPPPKEMLRVDVDVAFREDGLTSGMGFVVRNFQGKIIFAGCQTIGCTATVLMGELHALMLAVGHCLENDTSPIVVFTDSLLATHVLSD